MDTLLHIMDVLKILLDGGHIAWISSLKPGEGSLEVMTGGDSKGRGESVGAISPKLFQVLYSNGIIRYTGDTKFDEQGRFYSCFYLVEVKDRSKNACAG